MSSSPTTYTTGDTFVCSVPSASSTATWLITTRICDYRVHVACDCRAASTGRACWHRAIVARCHVADHIGVWHNGELLRADVFPSTCVPAPDGAEPAWVSRVIDGAIKRGRAVKRQAVA